MKMKHIVCEMDDGEFSNLSGGKVIPIKPSLVADLSLKAEIDNIPDYVVSVINGLIIKNFARSVQSARIMQNEVINAILTCPVALARELTREQLFAEHMLDFEEVFRSHGWRVSYDRPAYNENYEASFKFSVK